SNPAAPTIVGTLTTATSGVPTGATLAVGGGYAFVAENSVLRVVNVATPTNPTLVTTVTTPASAVGIDGTRLYVLGGSPVMLKIFNVASPSAPSLLSTTDAQGSVGVTASGTVAYLASPSVNPLIPSMGGLYLWNVTTPSAPTVLANYAGVYDNWGVAVAGTLAVSTQNSLGLRVLDVSVPSTPT